MAVRSWNPRKYFFVYLVPSLPESMLISYPSPIFVHFLFYLSCFLWSIDTLKKEPGRSGTTFVTIPGLQTSMQPKKRDRVEVTYKTLRYEATKKVHISFAMPLPPEQGCLKVQVFKPKKIVFRSDPSRAIEQLEAIKNSVFSNQVAKSIGPLSLAEDSSVSRPPSPSRALCFWRNGVIE